MGHIFREPRTLSAGAVQDAEAKDRLGLVNETEADESTCVEVIDSCKSVCKQLVKETKRAKQYREKCRDLLGASLGASLLLEEALHCKRVPMSDLTSFAVVVEGRLQQALGVVRKYGGGSGIDSLLRWPSRVDVDQAFDDVKEALSACSHDAWTMTDHETRVKRLLMASPQAGAPSSTERRHILRSPNQHKVLALESVPSTRPDEGTSVCWATHRQLKVCNLTTEVTMSIPLTSLVSSKATCIAPDGQGYLWTGHESGEVFVWQLEGARSASLPLLVFRDSPVCALAPGPVPLTCWAASQRGEVAVVELEAGRVELKAVPGEQEHEPSRLFSMTSRTPSLSSLVHSGAPIPPSSSLSLDHELPPSGLLNSCLPWKHRANPHRDRAVHKGAVTCIVVRGEKVYSVGKTRKSTAQVLIWSGITHQQLGSLELGTKSTCTCLSFFSWQDPDTQLICDEDIEYVVTGHSSGLVQLGSVANNVYSPILHVGKGDGGPVCAVGVFESLGLLVIGYDSGRVVLRRLDPKLKRTPPALDGRVPVWNPEGGGVLWTHRLGLDHAAVCPRTLVTAGYSGSIKVWPESSLRLACKEPSSASLQNSEVFVEALGSVLGSLISTPSSVALGPISREGSRPLSDHTSTCGTATPTERPEIPTGGEGASSGSMSRGPVVKNLIELSESEEDGADRGAVAARRGRREQYSEEDQVVELRSQSDPFNEEEVGARPSLRELRCVSMNSQQVMQELAKNNLLCRKEDLEFGRVLGEGSYGRVHRGKLRQSDEVAIKVLKSPSEGFQLGGAHMMWDAGLLKELVRESQILSKLRHSNVVQLRGVCPDPPIVVTEFCHLGSLYDVLRSARREPQGKCGRMLTWARRINMALDVANGMYELHSNSHLVHRDLKSPNLFVTKSWDVKVGDFNLSRYLAANRESICSTTAIRPHWSAPETLANNEHSKKSDVYSYGMVLWELLTWQQPWDDPNMNDYQIMASIKEGQRPEIPPWDQLPGAPGLGLDRYIRLMQCCWAQYPQDRPLFDVIREELQSLQEFVRTCKPPGSRAPSPVSDFDHRNEREPARVREHSFGASPVVLPLAPVVPVGNRPASFPSSQAPVRPRCYTGIEPYGLLTNEVAVPWTGIPPLAPGPMIQGMKRGGPVWLAPQPMEPLPLSPGNPFGQPTALTSPIDSLGATVEHMPGSGNNSVAHSRHGSQQENVAGPSEEHSEQRTMTAESRQSHVNGEVAQGLGGPLTAAVRDVGGARRKMVSPFAKMALGGPSLEDL